MMKYRWIAVLAACLLLGSLAACGGQQESASVPSTPPVDESQNPVSAAPEKDEPAPAVSLAPVIEVSKETEQVVQESQYPETHSAALGGAWPDNEFTRQMPALSVGTISMSLTQSRSFELLASDIALEEAKAYIDATIAMGFNVEGDLKDYTESGIEAYTYHGGNSAGYQVELSYSVGLLSITVKK